MHPQQPQQPQPVAYEHAWDDPTPTLTTPDSMSHDGILAQGVWPVLAGSTTPALFDEWAQAMRGLHYLTETGELSPLLLKNGSAKQRDDMVARTVSDTLYEFAYNEDDPKDIYWRKRADGPNQKFSRVPVDKEAKWLKSIVRNLYQMFFRLSPAMEVKACIENIYQSISKPADLSNGLWHVVDNLFWDSDARRCIPPSDLNGREVYREIGATSSIPGVEEHIIKDTFDAWTSLLDRCANPNTGSGSDWERFYQDLPIPDDFKFVKVWANEGSAGWVDRYWDICIATATNFMYQKPPVMYMLKGKSRNGKSSYVDHLHQLIGRHQTTDLTLTDLADWSLNNSLFGSLMNAPDEDQAGTLNAKATAAFKTLSAKAEMKVQVKYSSVPLRVKPNFMLFVPRNDIPEFFGDPIPCMKRIKFIFFLNDLSRMDNLPHDFWGETFEEHPEVLSRYVGFLLALAKYFNEHPMWYSKTMDLSADYIAEVVASTNLYYRIWSEFFAGYESFDLLKKDYLNFCKARGYKPNDETVLRSEFFQEGQHHAKRHYPGTNSRIYMFTTKDSYSKEDYRAGRHILCRDEVIPKYGRIGDIVANGGLSAVDILKKLQEEELSRSPLANKHSNKQLQLEQLGG